MHKFILSILLTFVTALSASAMSITLSPEASVSLVSCTPGRPSYLHYGHSALRILDPQQNIDWAFNYGLFSFSTDNFYGKFVAGKTDYLLGIQNYGDFLDDCEWNDRNVYEQVLRLDSAQRQQVMDALMENYLPENRVYRYNFVFDNCATRPWKILCKALGDNLQLSDLSNSSGCTYRENISYYSGNFSWMNFGINLAFGTDADCEMTLGESLFLPENLMHYVETVRLASGEPLCAQSTIKDFVPRKDSWMSSPQMVLSILMIILGLLTWLARSKGKVAWVMHGVLFFVYAIAGVILVYLRFFSVHPFVSSNWNILVLNPLWLIPFVMVCTEKGRAAFTRVWPWCTLLVIVLYVVVLFLQGIHWFNLLVLVHTLLLYLALHYQRMFIGRGSRVVAMLALLCCLQPISAQNLKVVVVVDGLNSEVLQQLRPYWTQGGLRTLSEEAYQTEVAFPHMVYGGNEALATLMTGLMPAEHGISADTYFNRSLRLAVSTMRDGNQSGIGSDLRLSPEALLAPTSADYFRMKEGAEAKIYAIGLSPEAVITLAGHSANACCWLESSPVPHWATTTFYKEGLPSTADGANAEGTLIEQAARIWTPRLDYNMYMHPTEAEKKKGFSYEQNKCLLHSPIANTMVINLALDLQQKERMGQKANRDMLLLHLNLLSPKATSDAIRTAEQEDMYLWLNQDLGYLMEQLTKRLGTTGYEIVLMGLPKCGTSADAYAMAGMKPRAFNVDRASALINTYLMAIYGHERWVDGGYMNSIYLNRTLIEQKHLSLIDMQREVAALLLDFEGVRTAFPSTDLHLLPADGEYAKLRNSLTKRTAGDVCYLLEPCWGIHSSDSEVFDFLLDPEPTAPIFYWSQAKRSFPEIHSALELNQLIIK